MSETQTELEKALEDQGGINEKLSEAVGILQKEIKEAISALNDADKKIMWLIDRMGVGVTERHVQREQWKRSKARDILDRLKTGQSG